MLKHINFQATEYVIVTGGNGRVKSSDMDSAFSTTMHPRALR